jgi:hypothetical protein
MDLKSVTIKYQLHEKEGHMVALDHVPLPTQKMTTNEK